MDDRFTYDPDATEQPTPVPCRRHIDRGFVDAKTIDQFTDEYAKRFGCGRARRKPVAAPKPEPIEREPERLATICAPDAEPPEELP